MGSSMSIFWSSSNDNVVDPGTGLTAKQKKLVQNTWAIVKKDPISSGTAMMIAFFKKYPDYQNYFEGFKNIPLEELPSCKKFQAHCLNLVTAFNNIVDSINDLALLEANLNGIGERHFKRGQTKEHFLNLKIVLLDVLRQKLGAKYTCETSEAWSKTMDAAFNVIMQSYST